METGKTAKGARQKFELPRDWEFHLELPEIKIEFDLEEVIARYMKQCTVCGKPIMPPKKKYCSLTCKLEAMVQRLKEKDQGSYKITIFQYERVTFRSPSNKEIIEIQQLVYDHLPGEKYLGDYKRLKNYRNSPVSELLLLDDNKGCLCYTIRSKETWVSLIFLIVRPEYRGQGIARAAIQYLKSLGKPIRAVLYSGNQSGVNFLGHMGFKYSHSTMKEGKNYALDYLWWFPNWEVSDIGRTDRSK